MVNDWAMAPWYRKQHTPIVHTQSSPAMMKPAGIENRFTISAISLYLDCEKRKDKCGHTDLSPHYKWSGIL